MLRYFATLPESMQSFEFSAVSDCHAVNFFRSQTVDEGITRAVLHRSIKRNDCRIAYVEDGQLADLTR